MRTGAQDWYRPAAATALAAVWLSGCGSSSESATEGDLHVTRNRVELYAGLEPDAPASATLAFDTPVRVLDQHRSFAKIRTPTGLEGWAAKSLLLDRVLRRQLQILTGASSALPSQGRYRSRDTLNVHIQPYRWSPTVYQLEKDEEFQILDRVLVDRLPASAATAAVPPEPTGEDYWYLVRVPAIDHAGWLIANMAYSDIPLEVAMLAGGHSIVSYFELGSVEDTSLQQAKSTWLWTQSTGGGQVHDFDRLQVLKWDARRDRYLVTRQYSGLEGYLPIELDPDMDSPRGSGSGVHFLYEGDGGLRRRTLVYTDGRVYPLENAALTGLPRFNPPAGFGSKYRFSPLRRRPD